MDGYNFLDTSTNHLKSSYMAFAPQRVPRSTIDQHLSVKNCKVKGSACYGCGHHMFLRFLRFYYQTLEFPSRSLRCIHQKHNNQAFAYTSSSMYYSFYCFSIETILRLELRILLLRTDQQASQQSRRNLRSSYPFVSRRARNGPHAHVLSFAVHSLSNIFEFPHLLFHRTLLLLVGKLSFGSQVSIQACTIACSNSHSVVSKLFLQYFQPSSKQHLENTLFDSKEISTVFRGKYEYNFNIFQALQSVLAKEEMSSLSISRRLLAGRPK